MASAHGTEEVRREEKEQDPFKTLWVRVLKPYEKGVYFIFFLTLTLGNRGNRLLLKKHSVIRVSQSA